MYRATSLWPVARVRCTPQLASELHVNKPTNLYLGVGYVFLKATLRNQQTFFLKHKMIAQIIHLKNILICWRLKQALRNHPAFRPAFVYATIDIGVWEGWWKRSQSIVLRTYLNTTSTLNETDLLHSNRQPAAGSQWSDHTLTALKLPPNSSFANRNQQLGGKNSTFRWKIYHP